VEILNTIFNMRNRTEGGVTTVDTSETDVHGYFMSKHSTI